MPDINYVPQTTVITSQNLQTFNDLAWKGRNPIYLVSTGSSTAYVLTLPAPTLYNAYVAGDTFTFKAHVSNTGASTINVNGLGAKNIIKNDGSAMAAGDIDTGGIVTIVYDGVAFQATTIPAIAGGGGGLAFPLRTTDAGFSITRAQARSGYRMDGNIANGTAVNLFQGLNVNGTLATTTNNNFLATLNADNVCYSGWSLRGGAGSNFTEAANFGCWYENNLAQTWAVEIDCNNEGATQTLGSDLGGWGICLNTGSTYSPDTGIVITRATGAGTGPGWRRGLVIKGARDVGIAIEAMAPATYPGMSPAAPGTINALQVALSSDSQPRYQIDQNGGVSWGPGTGGPDCNLFRSSANVLKSSNARIYSLALNDVDSSYTSSIASSTGTITSASITQARFYRVGMMIFFDVYYNIATVGTGAGNLQIGLPTTATAQGLGGGVGNAASLGMSNGKFTAGSQNFMSFDLYNAGTVVVAGNGHVSGWYYSAT